MKVIRKMEKKLTTIFDPGNNNDSINKAYLHQEIKIRLSYFIKRKSLQRL